MSPPSSLSMDCAGRTILHDEVTVPPIWWTTNLEKSEEKRSVAELATTKEVCGSFWSVKPSTFQTHCARLSCQFGFRFGPSNAHESDLQPEANSTQRCQEVFPMPTAKSICDLCCCFMELFKGHCAWSSRADGLLSGSSDAHRSGLQLATYSIPRCPGVHEQCTCECCCMHANMQAHEHVHTVCAQLSVDPTRGSGGDFRGSSDAESHQEHADTHFST